ncbi:MAG TPA: hypothetical protein VMH04_03265 [Candidatus Solibacter sp.]|nr:hypothetical protein [Candidatus Solibacter sp.]
MATRPFKFAAFAVATVLLSIAGWSQTPQEVPAAPLPSQIAAAKAIFISNAGEENGYLAERNHWYPGGPARAYNQFYAAMKSWGRYELVSTPGDAELIFEIQQQDQVAPSQPQAYLMLRIIELKTHTTLWTLWKPVDIAGRAANREKNYNLAVTALVDGLKNLVSPAAPKN